MKSSFRILARLAAALLGVALAASAGAADWSDTEIQLLHGTRFNDNGSTGGPRFAKTIVTLQHASGYSLGRNFFFVDLLQSDRKDDHNGELYAEYYHTLSLTKLAKADWSKRVLRDVGLTAGVNFGAKNSAFGSHPRVLLLGPTLEFNLPGFAFFNVDVLAYRDTGRFTGFGGGALCGRNATTYQITPAWSLPFALGGAKLEFSGFADFVGSHGTCSSQLLTQPQLRWDVGHHFGRPGAMFVGVEVQHWRNKFGIKGMNESFPQLLLAWKF